MARKLGPMVGPISLVAMAGLAGCASVFVEYELPERGCREAMAAYLQTQGYELVRAEDNEIWFRKGQQFQFTFDYENSNLETLVALVDSDAGTRIKVGNSGMVGDIHLLKKKFVKVRDGLAAAAPEVCSK